MGAEIGRPAPEFTLDGTDDTPEGRRSYSLSEFRGQPVVLVFYPGDSTPVCTRQLNAYTEDIASFEDAGAQVLAIESFADHATERLCNYLQAYGLRFETQAFRNDRGVTLRTVVSVLPDVPASITAYADWPSGTVRLKLRNVEAIGDAEYTYDPPEIDRKLLDELAKLILAQPNEFRSMGKHQESLRVRIVATPPRREPDAALEAEPDAPSPAVKPGLFGGLKSLWKK